MAPNRKFERGVEIGNRLAKQAYDRKNQKRVYAKFLTMRSEAFLLLGNACYLCSRPAIKGFNLHHITYDAVESDYARHSKTMNIRIKRVKEAILHPERFRLLCPKCHRLVESAKSQINTEFNLIRLFELVL